ncbi:MAG: preprotein translocase subunit SecG [Phycisphaerae bacterium]|jgi:preprotein translocase subunit SecG|nr:preprotein translocase subunit SecG [Phycisphaerae bacterium]
MSIPFFLLTLAFVVVSGALVLIILVQRPQGGGLATAFGGAGGGNDTAFGGRTGDALTVATVGGFFVYLVVAIGLNIADTSASAVVPDPAITAPAETTEDGSTPSGETAPKEGAANNSPASGAPAAVTPPTTPPATQPTTPPATPASSGEKPG